MHQPLFQRLDPKQLFAIDSFLALIALLVNQYAAMDASTPNTPREPLWLSIIVPIVIAVPVAARRRWPLPALAVVMAATVASLATGVIPTVAVAAPISAVAFVLYLVASVETRRTSGIALVACLVAFGVAVVLQRVIFGTYEAWLGSLSGIVFGWLILAGGWTIGLTTLQRRIYTEETAAQHTRRAVAEERLRIARELHDIVAHSMSLIAVKAGIGNHVAEARPEEAREALRVIEATSRGSLAEMRHLLGVLRSGADSPDLSPAPGPERIPALAQRAHSAGVDITLELTDTSALPEGVGLSVYRIVQEALTNVVKHAAPARCQVRIELSGQDVRIEVANDGPKVTEPDGAGHGLIGMRERVAMYGGTFEAGPRKEGGFVVSAVLPMEGHWSAAKERSPSGLKHDRSASSARKTAHRRASAEHATREDDD